MWVYILSEKPCRDNDFNALYTVGFYGPNGDWNSDSDHEDKEMAARRVHWLNGGKEEG